MEHTYTTFEKRFWLFGMTIEDQTDHYPNPAANKQIIMAKKNPEKLGPSPNVPS